MSVVAEFPRITPFLWFDANAEEAVDLYCSIFANARRLGESRDGPEGAVVTLEFELDGQRLIALNGGPLFHFNESVSLMVRCHSQEEVDAYWEKLSAGGSEGRGGWLKDQFGVSWQVIPVQLSGLIRHPKALQAMMQMKKIDLAVLEEAAGS